MRRGVDDRVADVRRLVAAARVVFDRRAALAPAIAASTGLTLQGVDLGFESLEREASEEEIRALVAGAGDSDRVHVVVAANVFVAPLRALALARAAAGRVTVRPSSREPTLTRAILEACADDALAIVDAPDVAAIDCDEIHVYGRDSTVEMVRRRARPGTRIRSHGAGLGIAAVTASGDLEAAAVALARDVVAFDQRGCLSPRVVFVEGDAARGVRFGAALHRSLQRWEQSVPRGALTEAERIEVAHWLGTMEFAGRLWRGTAHGVAITDPEAPLAPPPTGRHVRVVAVGSIRDLAAQTAPFARLIVAAGADDPAVLVGVVPLHVRIGPLGRMQRPPLDGSVDRRSGGAPGP